MLWPTMSKENFRSILLKTPDSCQMNINIISYVTISRILVSDTLIVYEKNTVNKKV
jgi:hypothetical protein